ncbi:methyl-accepting chemotaxis protein [sulfur-oxidizing endosymbiont of Gigantopelta aegis]|uniref:methyl-accepting chemotaxis protein n=1 Tax=sulfur-oxidizing endosymbiont of Gigantopelta aegis TaxID=2794934 RepID=UPI0018DCDDEE|nr:methyl-accepting chemotaxis protein [sulfur-oxidizing endosymbiont of Gigantopelta aegis]
MSLKNRIVITVIVMIVIIVTAGFISSYLNVNEAEERYNELAINGKKQLWDLISVNQYAQMEPNIKNITRDRKLKKAIEKKDINYLYENVSTTFNSLVSQGVISNLQLTDNTGKIIFDALDKNNLGKNNQLSLLAIKEKKNKPDITLSSNGEFQAELVFPITKRGKVIGVGSFSLYFDKAINLLKNGQHIQVYIADISGRIKSYSEVDLNEELSQYDWPVEKEAHFVIKKDDKIYSTTILTIKHGEQLIGNLITISDNTASYNSQKNINITAILLLIIISIAAIIFIYLYLGKSLKPLHSISKSLTAVSQGDLTVVIAQSERQDEIAEIEKAISNTINKLHGLVSKIKPLVYEVNQSSEGLSESMMTNQSNISQQKDNIKQLSNAAMGVETAIANISQNSQEMTSHSKETNRELCKGDKIIQETINSIKKIATHVERSEVVINELSEETESIGGILDVIKSIAEQTNLLALNAAIEAARAGEQGRGFAVVADEVRSLAGKTQESTLEIEQMIDLLKKGVNSAVNEMKNSSNEVEACVDLANQTEASLRVITPKVSQIETSNIEINNSISEQKAAIEGINENILTISQLSENNVKRNLDALIHRPANNSLENKSMTTAQYNQPSLVAI